MRTALAPAFLLALTLGGCAYVPDPLRTNTSSADIRNCRRLGSVGEARTDGYEPGLQEQLVAIGFGEPRPVRLPRGRQPVPGTDFGERYDLMREAALRLGATDLYLARRRLRDYSYVEGIAYRCRR